MNDKGAGKTPAKVVDLLTAEVAKKSQIAVARETGLTLLTVQRYLKGIGEPREKNLKRLADYFKRSVSELRGDILYDFFPESYGFAKKFLLTANVYFVEVLKRDYREFKKVGILFDYIEVVLSLAKMVIDMPSSMTVSIEQKFLVETQELAKEVVNRYADYLAEVNN
jgi:transcriptional regulator with XRE-family HTH domain